jgi:hypothetical protein
VVAGEDCLFDTERRARQSELFQAEPAVKVLDDSVALACGGFEAFAVQYLHLTAHVFNQPGIFQDARRQAHTRTSGTEHLREELVG